MKKLVKIVAGVILAAVAVVGGGVALGANGVQNPVSDAIDQAKYDAANAAIDATGIKGQIDSALRSNTGRIAQQTGLPESVVEGMIDGLDVESWKVVPLPAGASATNTSNVSYGGYDAKVTTYDDPSVVTVATDSGEITLEVPANAQGYLQYLQYM